MKVIIDTNIVIDALYDRINNCLMIIDLANKNKITPVISQELEREYSLIAGKVILNSMRDSFKAGTLKAESFDAAQDVLRSLHKNINKLILDHSQRCTVTSNKNISPDYGDNKIINLAIDSNSSCIITKNVAHFRCLEQRGITNNLGVPIKIMTPKQFNYYYKEHQVEIKKEMERVNIIEKYISEFKQAKYWSYEDAKVIDNINVRFGKFLSVEQLRHLSSHYFAEVDKLNDIISNINKTAGALKEAEGWISKYDINKNTVGAYESAKLLKPVSKTDYEFTKNEMSVAKGFLTQLGIKDRSDYSSKLANNNRDRAKLPELEKELAKSKNIHQMFSQAVSVINKSVDKDISITKDLVKEHTKVIDIDR